MNFKRIAVINIFTLALGCGGSPTSSTPTPSTTTTTTPVAPRLISHDAVVTNSSRDFRFVSWKFEIDSPLDYGYAFVEAKWFDANGFQVERAIWTGALKAGTHTYTDQTLIAKDIWSRVVRREVVLVSWR